ncbi:hypothetical protein [Nocardioides lacusdianchii]|uniref:hypothetical protein n=1 Tax=Nocardioides lacusdianchii TaxID=2783664 RepID=UPI001CCCC0F2|nr:hypothetical protein [Nocardioides lacusdianchii]
MVGIIAVSAPILADFDTSSTSDWISIGIYLPLLILFLTLALLGLKKRPLKYQEVSFKYPRGTIAAGTHEVTEGWFADRRKKKVAETDEEIRQWMLRQLERSSSATIFTRDLSWAKPEDDVFVSRGSQFTIIACIKDELTSSQVDHLAAMASTGCHVVRVRIASKARFTKFESGGNSYYAVALPEGRKHVIRTTDDKKDPVYRLAKASLDAAKASAARRLPSTIIPDGPHGDPKGGPTP